ncbi:uncharacterized protein BCR38DRAFT_483915 [Pseudomassariella vexata]|uniref:Uncharacterized protein n=1 Tax=Pseudomassariella vexata TaxID=1141098 RepID=A0A1Y2E4J5_9PEZI|nr:uncharacterized protein BCR38DRAFT_483915 [Pseudomassariella vexata]ORY66274.1 hypothetical protein BCR38DRAFT_483915 [Pseudomassariella vexata]
MTSYQVATPAPSTAVPPMAKEEQREDEDFNYWFCVAVVWLAIHATALYVVHQAVSAASADDQLVKIVVLAFFVMLGSFFFLLASVSWLILKYGLGAEGAEPWYAGILALSVFLLRAIGQHAEPESGLAWLWKMVAWFWVGFAVEVYWGFYGRLMTRVKEKMKMDGKAREW